MDDERIAYLENLLTFIENNSNLTESNVERLIARLETEVFIEEGREADVNKNPYLNNLNATESKQMRHFNEAGEKDKLREYNALVDNFRQDVLVEIVLTKHLNN